MKTEMYRFKTRNFEVVAYIEPEEMDPADSFEFEEDIEAVRSGALDWFGVEVAVYKNGHKIGSDYLGGCAYKDAREFFTSHRDPDDMNRNCEPMRKARGANVCIGHYFPGMVAEAIKDARRTLEA